MKYPWLDLGTIEAILNKLGGKDGVRAFLSGKLVLTKANKTGTTFTPWRTIKLGTEKATNALQDALMKAGCFANDFVLDAMDQSSFTVSKTKKEVDIIVVSVAEFGFENGASLKDIYAKGQEWGLKLCSLEVCLQLRLQYMNQPKGEHLYVATKPVIAADGTFGILSVARLNDGSLCLGGGSGHPSSLYGSADLFVFALPRT
jgi:hypothetical protein